VDVQHPSAMSVDIALSIRELRMVSEPASEQAGGRRIETNERGA